MIFRVVRTTDDAGDKAPCQNARFVKRDRANEWSSRKVNYWEVELDSLEDLMHLIEETGNALVIFGADEKDGPMIEIYDDYRE